MLCRGNNLARESLKDQHCYIPMYLKAAIIFNDALISGPMASCVAVQHDRSSQYFNQKI